MHRQILTSIILIGMPGSGKSTVGRILAKRLGCGFTDTDDLIIARNGEPLQETIRRRGREEFLESEREVLLNVDPETPTVISTGGSAVLHEDAMLHLRRLGTTIFLDADLPLLKKRLWNADTRGIVFGKGRENDIKDVYREREPLYYRYADKIIHIRGKKSSEIAEIIISGLPK